MIEIKTQRTADIGDIIKIINDNTEGFAIKINELEKRISRLEKILVES